MPSEAQLARVNTSSVVGKVANKTALLSEQVRNITSQQTPAYCAQVFNSGNIAIASGGWTALQFDTAVYDGYSMYSVGAPTRLTCVVPGKYIAMVNARWNSSVAHASGAGVRLYLNGTTIFGEYFFVSSDIRTMALTQPIHLQNIGDYVEAYVIQNTGAPVSILTEGAFSPTLGVAKYG